jgi:predicted nuclease of restriction endonuclease-like (RecB) superfamily
MRAFAEAWPDRAIVQQLAAQIPWGQNCVLPDRLKDATTRAFYIRKTVEHGWSRSVLIHQLDTNLHKRLGKAPSNFALTLPSPQSDLAREILKDPYIFKPAPLDESATERALEKALLDRLKDFLIEMGAGFAFVGNQYRIEVDGDEFFPRHALLSHSAPLLCRDRSENRRFRAGVRWEDELLSSGGGQSYQDVARRSDYRNHSLPGEE